MGLKDISREAVLAAIAEHDNVGAERFRRLQGVTRASRYVVMHEGSDYDAKVLVLAAHRSAVGAELGADDVGAAEEKLIARLGRLGFEFRNVETHRLAVGGEGFGEIPGIPEGTTFVNRRDAFDRGVHKQLQAGISGKGDTGAKSIVVSGGYSDDKDFGDEIIYTGHGGRSPSGKQIEDQSFKASGNAALVTSSVTGEPVRVIRGADKKSSYAPDSGLRYDGLYRVAEVWRQPGEAGFMVCQFRMIKLAVGTVMAAEPQTQALLPIPAGNDAPARVAAKVQRLVRSTQVVNYVKQVHDDVCQTCGVRLRIGDKAYSEGAHIRGLGRPHNGPDVYSNVLCLCPNCHVLFDYGAMVISEDMKVVVHGEVVSELRQHVDHHIDKDHLDYHREHYT
ncbi:YDG/SRA domain-containing protein [Amycolatopsis japonica]|uniref:YDG/SRA domain-containing protein n=1 Tax=Amycolatopsis japonica TaxID=208439 RepID=UPI001931135D|nr:YDG/SRA domain-containing protein [Amycolatopsis japonica]